MLDGSITVVVAEVVRTMVHRGLLDVDARVLYQLL